MGISVVIVDDHPVVIDGLRRMLSDEKDIEVVATAHDGRSGLEAIGEHQPDVAIVDVSLPEMSGAVAVGQMLSASADTQILALSMHNTTEVISDMLRAGALGYVVKTAPAREVIEAVRAVSRGMSFLSPQITGDILAAYLQGRGRKSSSRSGGISDREKEVLQLVAEGKSSKEIASLLHVAVRTVEWHRKSIMDKLNLHTVAQLTKYAIRQGLTTLEC
jgi:DNA-binding NarL/FixJ family response regulator